MTYDQLIEALRTIGDSLSAGSGNEELYGDIFAIIDPILEQHAEPEPTRIIVALEGGLITGVISDGAHPVEVVSIDYDVEGLEPEACAEIPQSDGSFEPAVAGQHNVGIDPTWVDAAFAAVEEHEQEAQS